MSRRRRTGAQDGLQTKSPATDKKATGKNKNTTAARAKSGDTARTARDRQGIEMALIDPRPLGRASIKSMLEGADPHFAVVAYAQAADLIANSRNGAKPISC